MEINNIDKIIKDQLKSRTIQPSNSAWERLSSQLDEVPQKKKYNWFLYVGFAAGILLLISVTLVLNFSKEYLNSSKKQVNNVVIDSTKLIKPIEEKSRIRLNELESISNISNPNSLKAHSVKKTNLNNKIESKVPLDVNNLNGKIENIEDVMIKKESNSRIKISSKDLLLSVTSNQEIAQNYYTEHHIDRDELLRVVQKELNEQSLNIAANVLLAEVEKSVDEETFKKSFMKLIKGEFKTLTTGLANRND